MFERLKTTYNPHLSASQRWTDEDIPTIAAAASYLHFIRPRGLDITDHQVDAYLFQYKFELRATREKLSNMKGETVPMTTPRAEDFIRVWTAMHGDRVWRYIM